MSLLAVRHNEGVSHQFLQRGCTRNSVVHESCLEKVVQSISDHSTGQSVVAEHVCQFAICSKFILNALQFVGCEMS